MSTSEIYNYRYINERLISTGQPTQEQLVAAAQEGFEVVVNLATDHSTPILVGEAAFVGSLGLTYYNIPVEWDNPQESDFAAFETLMQQLTGRKILLHCAANFRATAFYSLYAQKRLGWTEVQAEEFRASIWQGSNYPIWEAFVRQIRASLAALE